jgi:hypothetical protein
MTFEYIFRIFFFSFFVALLSIKRALLLKNIESPGRVAAIHILVGPTTSPYETLRRPTCLSDFLISCEGGAILSSVAVNLPLNFLVGTLNKDTLYAARQSVHNTLMPSSSNRAKQS